MTDSNYRGNSRFAGVMLLVATVASIAGGTLIQATLARSNLISGIVDDKWTLLAGVSLEVVNALAVLGIVAALWLPLKRIRPTMAIGYVGARIVEATVCAIAAFLPMALLASAGDGADGLAPVVIAVRGALVGHAVPIFFLVGAVLLYLMLYTSALVPRYIPIWGLVGVAGLLANLLIAQPGLQPLLVLPIIANEVYLGIYLIARGLRSPSLSPGQKSSETAGIQRAPGRARSSSRIG